MLLERRGLIGAKDSNTYISVLIDGDCMNVSVQFLALVSRSKC